MKSIRRFVKIQQKSIKTREEEEKDIEKQKEIEEMKRRDEIRKEMKEERREKYKKENYHQLKEEMENERERDVVESIALGKKIDASDLIFDQRLFNQNISVKSLGNDEDEIKVYDEPLFK